MITIISVLLLKSLTAEHFAARLKQAHLVTKADIDDFIQKTDFDR